MVLVQCKKITKFGGVPNIQGAHAVFRLGKSSLKKENLYLLSAERHILLCSVVMEEMLWKKDESFRKRVVRITQKDDYGHNE